MADFDGDVPFDTTVHARMELLEVRPHADMPEDWATEVIGEMTDGVRFAFRRDDCPDHGRAADPTSGVALWAKFVD